MTKPSWQDFATHDESIVPELWDGVIGAWAPCLGPTGSRLHDHSRRSNWGALTNMDNATDWVVSDGQYALDFDGLNDIVLFNPVALVNAMSISLWYKARTITTNDGLMYTGGSISEGVRFNAGIQYYSSAATVVRIATAPLNVWTHVVFTRSASANAVAYLNGAAQGTGTGTGLTISGFGLDYIGEDRYFDGQLDDVVFYNRVLSAGEVRQLYQLGRGGMYQRRRRSRIYIPQAGFQAAWARRQSQIIGGGL